jgi:short-subunit dehydrogenase
MKNINKKKTLVTGGTDGLGRLMVLELAKLGANVIVHGRNEGKANKVREEALKLNPNGNHDVLICDFNEPQSIEEKFSEISELDILINNAGVWAEGDTVEITADKIIELINVNLTSVLITTRTLLPVLMKSEFSQVLNVSSVAGVEIPADYWHTIYSAAKFGVQAFSEALAKEFTDKNMRVMGYYPGGMETNLFKKAGLDYKDSEPWMFDPQESVDAMVFMLSRNKKINIKRLDLVNHLEI